MAYWMGWLILAGVLVILELFSGTFYLLMLAIGLVAGAAAALAGAGLEWQIILAAIVGIAATVFLHRSRFGWQARLDTQDDPNVNLDIGQSVDVDAWLPERAPGASPIARVLYRGAPWDVEFRPMQADAGAITAAQAASRPLPGRYRIVAIHGSRLIVVAGG